MTVTDKQIKKTIKLLERRLENHSRYLLNEVTPDLDLLKKQLERVWVSNERFIQLEQAVADIAATVYKGRTGKLLDPYVR